MYLSIYQYNRGFSGGSVVNNPPVNAGDTSLIPGLEDPLEKVMATPVFLPGESHGRRSLVGYSPHDRKESDTTERLHSVTHSLIVPSAMRTSATRRQEV